MAFRSLCYLLSRAAMYFVVSKTEELIQDFWKSGPPLHPLQISGTVAGSLSWVWTSSALSAGQKTQHHKPPYGSKHPQLQEQTCSPVTLCLCGASSQQQSDCWLKTFWLEANILTHFKTSQTLSEPSHPPYHLCLLLCVIVHASVLYSFYIYYCVQLLFCSCIRTRIPKPMA